MNKQMISQNGSINPAPLALIVHKASEKYICQKKNNIPNKTSK